MAMRSLCFSVVGFVNVPFPAARMQQIESDVATLNATIALGFTANQAQFAEHQAQFAQLRELLVEHGIKSPPGSPPTSPPSPSWPPETPFDYVIVAGANLLRLTWLTPPHTHSTTTHTQPSNPPHPIHPHTLSNTRSYQVAEVAHPVAEVRVVFFRAAPPVFPVNRSQFMLAQAAQAAIA